MCRLRRFQPPRPPRHQAFRGSTHTPPDRCVRFAAVVAADHATLATGRRATVLPGPDFHRLEHASFAWRTGDALLQPATTPSVTPSPSTPDPEKSQCLLHLLAAPAQGRLHNHDK